MKKLLLSCFAIATLAGCPEPPPPPPVPTPIPTPQTFSHTVSFQGENLGKIAKWYTGSVDNWKAIAEANPDVNPKRLKKGTLIIVPYDLVTNFDPMPKKYISPAPRPTKKKEETFVVDETDSTTSIPPTQSPGLHEVSPVRTTSPIITAPSIPAVIESTPAATSVPTSLPTAAPTNIPPTATPAPIERVAPTLPPPPPTQVSQVKAPAAAEDPAGSKSMEDLLAEEKRVLEQLQKEFQGDNGLAPH